MLTDGDLVANLPITEIFEEHLKSKADITVVCGNDSFATDDGTYFEMDKSGKVTDVLVKLRNPRGFRGLDTFIISTELLKKLVDDCAGKDQYSWRRSVLQAHKDDLFIRAYIWNGYAAQIRSVQEYYERSMDTLKPQVRADLYTPKRPVIAKPVDRSSAYIGPEGDMTNSLIADGCRIEGTVQDSILFSGVTVEAGAVVKGCILFRDATVKADADISYIIGDKNVTIQERRHLAGYSTHPIVIEKNTVV